MTGIFAAALPVFGLLACLFLGFILLSSESRSGERIAYVFFGVGVAWLIASGIVLWPKSSHARLAPVAQASQQAASTTPALRSSAPAQYYSYRIAAPYGYAYPYGNRAPYGYGYAQAYSGFQQARPNGFYR